ncbi:winged helix-turn-helix domain-containing protein [Nonomuraea glycinis]|uniref:SARP family transcriptional regulator n=1 Tax=Nonomuraea glycinis TaxID=2047744 RepID=A0A918A3H3_9ACTN|nr:BTAD domain-containing putative transcriptional regulator [Nonomuraea glycinis]MCA2178095.1 winged helix-turn-helix domain-containing protein [Nonomuraea glycinis]GGP06097.1 SARP family transcriptional regulator [Nonomuraea glycinis]
MRVEFGVLGPVAAWDDGGDAVALKGPRHRAVLARLIVARRRVVPVTDLVEDLWDDPPPGAVGAVRTFVAALRRALEPDRPPRSPARLLVTVGPGYALRAEPDAVDAWRFERAVAAAATLPPEDGLARLAEALGWWRGPAYAGFADQDWARTERSRLAELRLHAVERQAEVRLALGRDAEAVPDLDAHVTEHPWREDAWRLLALALYRAGRQGDALAVLRRARTLLAEQLGVDPGPALRRMETDVLQHADHLDLPSGPGSAAARIWAQTAAVYDRTVTSGARARLESTVSMLRSLAVTGGTGLEAARRHRLAAIAAAEELGDADLTARVIGAYDVPAIWTRSDDPRQAARVVAAAERTLADLPEATGTYGVTGGHEVARTRLLATIALESRGTSSPRGPEAARQAEELARRLDDPALLAFALNGVFMQTFERAGLAPQRDRIGAELVTLSARHGLITYQVLGHLIRLQARSALADFAAADSHAAEVDRLAGRHELPLARVFTQWYRAMRLAETGRASVAETAYRDAAARLNGAGMPGLEHGLLPLALLCLHLRHAPTVRPGGRERLASTGCPEGFGSSGLGNERIDWGPYGPWVRPLVLLGQGRRAEGADALRDVPEPPRDLLFEALWCLIARAAVGAGDRETMRRAHRALGPAAAELAGAGSGLLTLGPVSGYLADLAAALR